MIAPLLSPSAARLDQLGGDPLELAVRHVMTPGVVTLCEDATIRQAFGAMVTHRVHAVLVVGRGHGTPLGWVTARGLLPQLGREDDLLAVRDAVTEAARAIDPGASVREALAALSHIGTTHLLVTEAGDVAPSGVVTDLDLMSVARR